MATRTGARNNCDKCRRKTFNEIREDGKRLCEMCVIAEAATTDDKYTLRFDGQVWRIDGSNGMVAANKSAYVAAVDWSTLNGNHFSTLSPEFHARFASDLLKWRTTLKRNQSTEFYAISKIIDESQDTRAAMLGL